MFSDNILKLINNSVFYNHTLKPYKCVSDVTFDVIMYGDFIRCNRLHQLVFIVVVLFFFFFSCTSVVKIAAADNNYI